MTPMAGGALRVETRESALRAEVLGEQVDDSQRNRIVPVGLQPHRHGHQGVHHELPTGERRVSAPLCTRGARASRLTIPHKMRLIATFHNLPPVSTLDTHTYMSCTTATPGRQRISSRPRGWTSATGAHLVLVNPHRDGKRRGRKQGHQRREGRVHERHCSNEQVIRVVDGEIKLGGFGPLRGASDSPC